MADNLSPQQVEFIKGYFDKSSPTFGNATQSAIKAGYTQEYADSITSQMPKWLSDYMGKHKRMLMKAEKVLENSLETKDDKLNQDTAKFLAKTLGKKHYSEKTETEVSGKLKVIWEE